MKPITPEILNQLRVEETLAHPSKPFPVFSDFSFQEIDFPAFDFSRARFVNCDLSGMSLADGRLGGGVFQRCDFYGSSLEGADLSGSQFEACDLRRLNQCCTGDSRLNLTGAGFLDCSMDELFLNRAHLGHAHFSRCSLREAMFLHCQLPHGLFEDCDLAGANLSFASLQGTRFVRSDLTGAYFYETDPASLDTVEGLDLSTIHT
jgi:uncharacterized protein YjbI with pentapeptide repeats